MRRKPDTIRFNQLDFFFFAGEDIFTSYGHLTTLRFSTMHSVEEMRSAMRYVLSICPKLRSIVEPTLFSYRIRILEESDNRLNFLFKDAFRVCRGLLYGTREYLEYRRALLNEPFTLRQGLPLKMRYLPDGPEPVFLISFHHTTCDGGGWKYIINSLLSCLNGQAPGSVQLDNPSLSPTLFVKSKFKVPFQIFRSYRLMRKTIRNTKEDQIVNPSKAPVDYFGPANMHQFVLTHDVDVLLAKARELGSTVTALLLAALTNAICQRAKGEEGDVIGLFLSMDLRPYFDEKPTPVVGNFAITHMIRTSRSEWDNDAKLINEINVQINQTKRRLREKAFVAPMLISRLQTLVGRKNFSRGGRIAKKMGLIPMSGALSNLGNLDEFNSHGVKAQLSEAISIAPHHGIFLLTSTLGGRINTCITYPEAEYSLEEIKSVITSVDASLGRFLTLSPHRTLS